MLDRNFIKTHLRNLIYNLTLFDPFFFLCRQLYSHRLHALYLPHHHRAHPIIFYKRIWNMVINSLHIACGSHTHFSSDNVAAVISKLIYYPAINRALNIRCQPRAHLKRTRCCWSFNPCLVLKCMCVFVSLLRRRCRSWTIHNIRHNLCTTCALMNISRSLPEHRCAQHSAPGPVKCDN